MVLQNPGNTKFYVSGASFVDGNTYSIPMYPWRDGQQVYCVVTDANGVSIQSNTVTLSLKTVTSIEIIKQPEDIEVAIGEEGTVSVEASGEGLTYTWYYKNPGKAKFYVSGESFMNGNTYTIDMQSWRIGQQVYCVITDANGDSVQTNVATFGCVK